MHVTKTKNHMRPSAFIHRICQSVLPVFISSFILAQQPAGYYDSALDLSGEALKAALYDIIKDHIPFTYTATSTDVWDILKETDRDTANTENVILFYSGWSVNAAQEYNNAKGWTRGRVWPKSHGDFGTGKGVGTDVHHIRPVDLSVNSARGNKDFDWGETLYVDGDGPTQCYSSSYSWEPRDIVKGDAARMLFYMAVRYEGENGEPDLELINDINTSDYTEPGKGFHGRLSTLLEWHESDPVDSFEIRRNEVIYSYQQNRNPFIDNPEFVKKIWSVTGTDAVNETALRIFPNPATDYICIESGPGQSAEVSLLSTEGNILMVGKTDGIYRFSVVHLPQGLYFVRVTRQNKIFTEKIVINR